MTRPKKKPSDVTVELDLTGSTELAVPGDTVDMSSLTSQLHQFSDALEQLQTDNRLLSSALADLTGRFKVARAAQRSAVDDATEASNDAVRLRATVERRDDEITELESELSKMQAQRADWEAQILAERDADVETRNAELSKLREELRTYGARVADLEEELDLERHRTAPDGDLVELMTSTGTTLVIDGEGMVETVWPEAAAEDRRSRVIDAADRFQKRYRTTVELVFTSTEGWDPGREYPDGLRIRVPHDNIPVPAALGNITRVRSSDGAVVTVSGTVSDEPWVSLARAGALMGLPVQASDADETAGVSSSGDEEEDLESALEAEK